jgi:hypothetical protein
LPYLGFVPDDLSSAPARVVSYLALQLSVSTDALQQYGDREHTRTDHLQEIQDRLKFRDADQHRLAALGGWLLDRALEHDRPIVLFHLACQWLLQERLVRPGVTRIERLVATIRERAQQETYSRLGTLLTPSLRDGLDALLQPTSTTGRTPLSWLQREATALTPRAILDEIDKLSYLRALGADTWQLNALTPNRRKLLAGIGRRSTNQALQRMSSERRFPILMAFLAQASEDVTDEIIDLFDRALTNSYARARRELDEFRRSIARSTNEKVVLFRAMGRVVLDPSISDADLRAAIYRQVLSEEELAAAIDDADRIMRPLDDDYFDLLADPYSHLRQFPPSLLSAFSFRSSDVDQELVQAIELVRRLNATGRRKVPEDAPIRFVPARWRTYVIDDDGRIDRRFYELCVLWELRAALRAGDVWVDGSRRYADPETYLISREEWPAKRAEACRLIGAPESGEERLQERQAELESILARLDRGFPQNDYVRLVGDDLTVAPVRGEDPPESAEQLRDQIVERLPRVDLPELLIEVDRWIGFTRAFQHAGGAEPRTKDLTTHLHAAIFAQACNFGLEQMAELADLSYRKLAWCATWYLREETLKPAIAQLVNFQHRQPLAAAWGSGTLSSSDGQRFPVTVKARNTTALPRYFGYGRGLTHYTWTSDQHALNGGKPIPSTERDATYVLDEILDNETELPIEQHSTDTAGYTELIFSLFDLVGLQFSPRIRDMADQRLFPPGSLDSLPAHRAAVFGHAEPRSHPGPLG